MNEELFSRFNIEVICFKRRTALQKIVLLIIQSKDQKRNESIN